MQTKDLRIAFVLSSPFPTRKAYGVTTRETLSALSKLSIPSKIFCLHGDYFDEDFQPIIALIENFHIGRLDKILIKFGKNGTLRINALCWRIGIILTMIKNVKRVQAYEPNVLWVRDSFTALLYANVFKNTKIILEVHDRNGKHFHKKLVRYNKQIRFFPINVSNRLFLQEVNPAAIFMFAPMGIRNEVIANEKKCDLFLESLKAKNYTNLKVGYVGKFSPGGYSKGIEDLVNLAFVYQSMNIDSSVTLVGAEESELLEYEEIQAKLNLDSQYLRIERHVRHTQALRMMQTFDVLVLTPYKSKTYNGMPIKLLEYLSSGRIVIIADTPLYRSFFNTDFEPFFYKPGDVNSLMQSIFLALESRNIKEYLLDAVKFCKPYTWDNRTLNILDFCLS
jgi:glycosyltransferase involved in cell wall biosynthesis